MTIEEKLTQIAENEQKVYNAGYDKALTEGYEKGYGEGWQNGHKGGYDEGFGDGEGIGFADGKQAEREAFWDTYLSEKNCQYLFYSGRWQDNNFYPTKDINFVGSVTFAFSSNGITNLKQRLIDCGVKLDTSKVTSGNYFFAFCSLMTHIPTLSFVGLTENINTVFDNCKELIEIEKIILKNDGSTTFVKWFDRLPKLRDIAFEGVIGQDIDFKSSENLTKASIESIVNALSSTASGKTLTLSKKAVDVAFGWYVDGEFQESGSVSGAWDDLVTSKSNWNIILAT